MVDVVTLTAQLRQNWPMSSRTASTMLPGVWPSRRHAASNDQRRELYDFLRLYGAAGAMTMAQVMSQYGPVGLAEPDNPGFGQAQGAAGTAASI